MQKVTILFYVLILFATNQSCSKSDTQFIEIDSVFATDSLFHIPVINEHTDSFDIKKYIYLTIDDAPLNGSYYIDSIISATKTKTSLFLVGNDIDGSKKFREYYHKFRENQFIEIYNHSYSHANNRYTTFYKNPETVLSDFERNQSDFTISHKIARLPGRNLWLLGERKKNYNQTGATSAELLSANGYKVFGWDVEWKYSSKDYTPKQSIDELIIEIEDCCNKDKAFTRNHIVLLMHNQMFGRINDKNKLDELITGLKESNFIFEYLSSYPELSVY